MTKLKIEQTVINSFIRKTNTKLRGVKKANASLFETVREAVTALQGDTKALSRYKMDVDCDRSSVNKIIKITESDFVMDNLDNLPSGWAALDVIARKSAKVDVVALETAIESGQLSSKTTLKEVRELFKKLEDSQDPAVEAELYSSNDQAVAPSSTKIIAFNEADFTEEERAQVFSLVEQLKQFGFEIKAETAIEKLAA
ncbi:MAG: hypothetical protein HWE12_00105 [Oceanospirillaceae bacterium]|nr:hypothetical protein [Oceanospirillaceae bacterium]